VRTGLATADGLNDLLDEMRQVAADERILIAQACLPGVIAVKYGLRVSITVGSISRSAEALQECCAIVIMPPRYGQDLIRRCTGSDYPPITEDPVSDPKHCTIFFQFTVLQLAGTWVEPDAN